MYDIDYSKVGKRMKQLRLEKGYTQESVAEDLDCTIAFISNVENNRAKLNLRVLIYYSKLCGVSIDYLLDAGRTADEIARNTPYIHPELLRILGEYTPEEQHKLVNMLKIWKEI